MKTETRGLSEVTTKLIAVLLIVLCLAVGAVGLILPLIPGLLFVAIALILVARFFPGADRRLRRNRRIRSYLDRADRLRGLSWPQQLQYGGLLCIRLLIDAVAGLVGVLSRLVDSASRRVP